MRFEMVGGFFHCFLRGNARQDIFRDFRDYEFFLKVLGTLNRRFGFLFHAYALIPNHYHLLIELTQANLSRGMHYLDGLYSQYFNKRWGRVGHLFQGRFRSILVDKETYYLRLTRYIHYNPVKAGLSSRPWEYAWASCRQYLGMERLKPWMHIDNLAAVCNYQDYLAGAAEDDLENEVVAQALLGSPAFVEKHLTAAREIAAKSREISDRRVFKPAIPPEAILSAVTNTFNLDLNADRVDRWSRCPSRKIAMLLLRDHSGLTLNAIAGRFGVGPAAVSKATLQLANELRRNRGLRGKMQRIIAKLHKS